MAQKYIITDRVYRHYLAKKPLKGYYTTSNIVEAIKCEDRKEADRHLAKQKLFNVEMAKILPIDFH